jgi:5-methylcytosine-specific restriction protein A
MDAAKGKHPLSAARSGRWPTVRKEHLEKHPYCAVCGGTEKREVHHREPFHLNPELELDPSNLVTLCESGKGGLNCHLALGHLGSFKSFNAEVVTDAAHWSKKIKQRPLTDS